MEVKKGVCNPLQLELSRPDDTKSPIEYLALLCYDTAYKGGKQHKINEWGLEIIYIVMMGIKQQIITRGNKDVGWRVLLKTKIQQETKRELFYAELHIWETNKEKRQERNTVSDVDCLEVKVLMGASPDF